MARSTVLIIILLLNRSFRFIISFLYLKLLFSFSLDLVALHDFFYFESSSFGNQMVPMDASGSLGGSNSISVGGESNIGGSSRGSGWTSFDIDVLAEPFPNEEGEEVAQPNAPNGLENTVPSPGAAQEALPQAPAPAEGGQPAPNQEEISALKLQIHKCIEEQVREYSEKGRGPLSTMFPSQREVNSETAHHIMGELELSTETNVQNLQEWAETLRTDKKRLHSLIKDYLPNY